MRFQLEKEKVFEQAKKTIFSEPQTDLVSDEVDLGESFCFAVEYLGFSKRDIPFYDGKYSGKGEKILSYLVSVGNFGKLEGRKDNSDMSVLLRKMDSFKRSNL